MKKDKLLKALVLIAALILTAGIISLASEAKAREIRLVRIVQARGGLRVRREPTTDAPAVYLLEDCTTVVVLDRHDGWSLVGYNSPPHSALGWVCADYLK